MNVEMRRSEMAKDLKNSFLGKIIPIAPHILVTFCMFVSCRFLLGYVVIEDADRVLFGND